MKRIITLITLAGACVAVQAQKQVIDVDAAPALAFYATKEWQQAFMGYYGVDTGVEPGIPEDPREREVLGQVRDLLQTGADADLRAAVGAVEALIREQQAAGTVTSPMMLQIAGTLEMRNAEVTKDEARSKQSIARAERYLKRAIDPNTGFPNFKRAHKNLANLLFRNDKAEEAKVHFVKAIELGDRDAVSFGILGAIYMEEGKLVSAESALRNSLMINPSIPQFKQLLGNVLLQQERYAEAKEIFAEMLQRSPNEPTFWMAQANCYIALEEIDQAARNLEIVRFMGKSNVPSLMLLGDVYMNKDMVDEATEVYLEAIAMEPSQAYLNSFIGAAKSLNNYIAYEQGMAVIEKIQAVYKGNMDEEDEIELLSLSSEINISLGKGAEAAANLEALLKRDAFNGRALLNLARYYGDLEAEATVTDEIERTRLKREYEQRAILYYERAQNLDDLMDRRRAYIGEAQLRVQRNELDQAADLLETAQGLEYHENVQAYLNQIRDALKNRRRG
ncbi:MAG: tetratricopeptide repeat protein [Puniceicoccaceae bacterium]